VVADVALVDVQHDDLIRQREHADQLRARRGGRSRKMASEFARPLRRDMTDAERRLWKHLCALWFASEKFHRQEPVAAYIVDFVSHRSRLIIELDGGQHTVQDEQDRERTRWLGSRGYLVIRFWKNQMLTGAEAILEAIALALAPSP
jgi:very-short-patch-repair endonuclease